MEFNQQAAEQQLDLRADLDIEEVRAVTLEEIAVREVQECSCICYYPAR
jgi:hypothetical protein